MNELLTDPLIYQIAISMTILLVLLYQRLKFSITPLNLPVLMTFFALIRSIVDFEFNKGRHFFNSFENLHFVFYALAIYTIYLFGERLTYSKYQKFRRSTVFFLLGIFVGTYFSGFLIQDYLQSLAYTCTSGVERGGCNPASWPLYKEVPYWEFFFDLFQVTVFSYLLYIFFQVLNTTSNKEQRRPVLLLIMAVFSFLILAILEFSEHFFHYEVNAWYTSLLGFAFMFYVFISKPRSLYSSSAEIYRLTIVLAKSGIPIFVQPFSKRPMFDISLLASLSMTINETFKEVTSSNGNIRGLDIEKNGIMMAHTSKIFTILEAEYPTAILKDALADFTKAFEQEYFQLIDQFEGQLLDSNMFNEFLSRYFPAINHE